MTDPRSTAQYFDLRADSYEDDGLSAWFKAQGTEVLRALEVQPGEVVLDIGCGTGWLLREMVRRVPEARGIGIDISPKMVDVAIEKASQLGLCQLTFLHGDWNTNGPDVVASRTGDVPLSVALCVSVLHYFENPQAALARIRSLLGEGGRLLILDRARERSLLTTGWSLIHKFLLRDEIEFYTSGELCHLLGQAGFSDVRVVKRIRRLFWKGKAYSSLVLLSAHAGTET